MSKKEQLYGLIRANPFISQQEMAEALGLSRSAVAGHVASLIRERRLVGRAYVLPQERGVLCIGAANLDRKLRTVAPLQMGTSNPATAGETFGGVARNIAENLARLGTPCALLTALGDDSAGQALRAHARHCGIDMTGTPVLPGAATGTYTAVLDAGGEMAVALADMALYEQLTPGFIASRQAQRNAASLVIADLNLPHDTVALLLDEARRDGIPLAIVAVSQPKMARLPRDLAGLRLLILNRGELEERAGRPLPTEAALRDACRAVQAEGARDVIVTCGAAGVYYTYGNTYGDTDTAKAGDLQWLPAHDVDVVDVTGAGDAFSAAVCWTLAQGEADLAEACARGLRAAALTVQSTHTVFPALTAALLGAPTLTEQE
ncbi:winged helix-turn-helix transcriptional regulator [Massilia dura]|uniref:Winged helix-turn-helix transcriptional regulator n=1 Tax=Pseudoduganella dura TaxID=321982 RepID=A0A6I3XE46_9BURK|nr:carbohydrate kinase [Pseudoduganella dura]MUI12503.1 winged helix-turn-helix transcriptional regulator [Pseudoduganella dura]GGX84368.1 carbohydrate kinase [Pseudoduganella dura]